MRFPCVLAAAPLFGILLAGCGDGEPVDQPPASRPVKLFLVEGAGTEALRNFPGSVRASKRADLAFRVPGASNCRVTGAWSATSKTTTFISHRLLMARLGR